MTDADADFFFGRERLTTDILEQLRQRKRMIALIGNSGVGKSSLVQAGVVAALRRQRWPGGGGRDWPSDLRDSRSWLVLTMKPGDAPVLELARAFVAQWTEPTDPARARRSAEWAMSLQETLGLAALMQATRDQFREGFGLPPPDRFVLLVDQAEELYTRAGEAEAHRFSEIVVAGLHDPTLTLLTSLRSDHYGHFQADAQLFANSVMVDVPPLREEGLRQVVERPPALLGAHFEDGNMGERVVNATARQPGALPLLSYLLEDLWKGMQRRADGVLRWSDYPELVGVRGVLARRAEEFFEICREGDQAVLQRLFTLRLVHVPAEGQVSSRRARHEECSEGEWRLAESLAGPDWRLLVFGGSGSEVTAEVAHEVLLRDWERLSRWLEAERAFLIWKSEIEGDRREWRRTSADEGALLRGTRLTEAEAWLARRGADLVPEDRAFVEASVRAREREQAAQTRRRRWIVGGSLTAAVVLAAFAVFAGWQWLQAQRYAEQAMGFARGVVQDAVKLGDQYVSRPAIGELLAQADTAFKQLGEDGNLFPSWQQIRYGFPSWQQIRYGFPSWQQIRYGFVPQLRSAHAEVLMVLADHYRINKQKQRWEDLVERAHNLLEKLVTDYPSHPSNPEWQRQLATSHDGLGDILADREDLDGALVEYHASQLIRNKLSTDNPNDPNLKRSLLISDIKIGEMRFRQGNGREAIDAFQLALNNSEQLAKDYPAILEYQRDMLMINLRIGDVLAKQKDLKDAAEVYSDSFVTANKLIDRYPSNTELQHDLATTQEKIGKIREAQGELEEARVAYQKSLSINERLAACDPENVSLQRDTSLSHNDLGHILLKQRQINPALDAFRASLAIAERLATTHPEDVSLQRELSMRLKSVGDALKEQNELQAALNYYRRSLAIRERLAAGNPLSTKFHGDLLVSHDRIGDVLEKLGQLQEAIAAYQDSFVLAKQLAATDPTSDKWQSAYYRQLGRIRELEKNTDKAIEMYCQAKSVIMKSSAIRQGESWAEEQLDWLEQRLAAGLGASGSPC